MPFKRLFSSLLLALALALAPAAQALAADAPEPTQAAVAAEAEQGTDTTDGESAETLDGQEEDAPADADSQPEAAGTEDPDQVPDAATSEDAETADDVANAAPAGDQQEQDEEATVSDVVPTAEADDEGEPATAEPTEPEDAPAMTLAAPAKLSAPAGDEAPASTGINVYRLYNPNSGEHFYTEDIAEARFLVKVGWNWEGCGWVSPEEGLDVYRLYNPYAGDHHYTMNAAERDWLVGLGWLYEGTGWKSLESGGAGVYRQYNPNATVGTHNFTTNKAENNSLVAAGWSAEGIAWNALSAKPNAITPFWLEQDDGDRFWVQPDANLAVNRIVNPSEGAGQYAYATSTGAVVRGAVDMGSWVYLADAKTGALTMRSGWVVTDAYGQGLQRYYLEQDSNGVYAAREGYSTSGYPHYTIPGAGYVVRGSYAIDGHAYIADNDGKMPTQTGWLTSSDYAGSSQKYYLESVPTGGVAAVTGFFTVGGSAYFAYQDGHVSDVPAKYPDMFYKAQSYSSPTGWLVLVDCGSNRCCVYRGSYGHWVPVKEWVCTTGAAYTPTKKGVFSVTGKGYSFGNGFTCYYYTQFYGDYLLHSILYYSNTFNVMDGRLGINASHGCVRLSLENAKYVYDYVPYGTTVATY